MIDLNDLRKNSEEFKKRVSKKAFTANTEVVLDLDQKRRELGAQVESLRAQRNEASKLRDIEKGRSIKEELDKLEPELKELDNKFTKEVLEIANPPLDTVPVGDESANQIIETVGEPKKFDFTPRDHVELGEMLDIIDIERAGKVSGSRFAYVKNEGAMLELALIQFAMSTLFADKFSTIIPPTLIKQQITTKLGYWHGGGNENYYLVSDYQQDQGESEKEVNSLYLVGTGEHAVVPMHSDEVLPDGELPKKYAAFSPSYRREAGTYGKDTRGILRVHQFEKVEMVEFVKPEDDEKERRNMLEIAKNFLQQLGLPFQVVALATGDLGFPSAETIDLETWIPSQNRYRETHSISTTTDFQARRLNIRYKDSEGKLQFVHILNGTALAVGRIIIAILENFQQADGTVIIPEVLRKYTNFSQISPKKKLS